MVRFKLFKSKKKGEEKKEKIPEPVEEIVEVEPLDKIEKTIPSESSVQVIHKEKEETFVSTPTDYYETLTSSDEEETKTVETREAKEWRRKTWEDISEIERKIDEMKIDHIARKDTNMEKKIDRILSKPK